jgi:hypothetical protein
VRSREDQLTVEVVDKSLKVVVFSSCRFFACIYACIYTKCFSLKKTKNLSHAVNGVYKSKRLLITLQTFSQLYMVHFFFLLVSKHWYRTIDAVLASIIDGVVLGYLLDTVSVPNTL